MVGPGPAPAIRQEMGFENWPGGLRGLQSERARAPRYRQSHGTGAANVTEITAFRFAGTGQSGVRVTCGCAATIH